MINIEDFKTILNLELQRTNLGVITQKIINQEHFDHILVKDLEPKKKLISEIIKYILLRNNGIHFEQRVEQDILNLQYSLSEQLSSINFDIGKHEHSQSSIFIEKIVVIALIVPEITKKLNLNFLTKIDPNQMFVVLIFLASRKLVSIRTFDLARQRMRARTFQRQKYSIYSTVESLKSTKRQKNDCPNSQFTQFKEDLKKNLSIEKKSQHQNKIKAFMRRNAAHFITKVSGSQKYQIIEPWVENTKKSFNKSLVSGKINSVSYNGRVSLDKNMMRRQLRSVCCSPKKNRTILLSINKPSKKYLRCSGEQGKRSLSVTVKP